MKVLSTFFVLSALVAAAFGQCPLQNDYDHANWPATPAGTTGHGTCRVGYWAGPDPAPARRDCSGDSEWSVSPTVRCLSVPRCPQEVIDGWVYGATPPSNEGQIKTGTCPLGFTGSGSKTRRCDHDSTDGHGVWNPPSGTGTCIQNTCSADGVWPETVALSFAEIPCASGFAGTRTRECSALGDWATPSEAGCTALPNFCGAETYDHTSWPETIGPADAVGICLPGYDTVGTATRPCTNNGWSNKGLKQRCLTQFCSEDTETIEGTTIVWPRLQARKRKRFLCPSGKGYATRSCSANAVWEPTAGDCLPEDSA